MANDPNPAPAPMPAPDPNAGAQRNVSYQDLQAVMNKLNSLESNFNSQTQQPANPQPAPAPAPQPASISPEIQKVLDENKALKAEKTQRELANTQATAAKDAGVDLGDMGQFLLGKDEDTTKSNVKAFADFMTKHDEALKKSMTPGTGAGFHVTKNDGTDASSALDKMMDSYFHTAGKEEK